MSAGRTAAPRVEPDRHGPAAAGRWADYLDWLRSELVAGVLGLPADAQRRTLVPSGWTPLELLSHVLHMEQRWFVWGFLGEPVDQPWGDWSGDRWQVPAEVGAESLAARLEAVGARTREILRGHPLDAVAATGGRFDDDPPTLEWICFHVVAEYARHAGHLDIVAELGAGLRDEAGAAQDSQGDGTGK